MIDTAQIKHQTDLIALIGHDTSLKRAASTAGGEFAGACPFCGGRDRFRVQPRHEEGGRWFCRGCGNGRWHDAIDYVMRRDSSNFRAAARALGGSNGHVNRARVPEKKLPVVAQPPDAEWQSVAMAAIQESIDYLNSGQADALAAARYLQEQRGLSKETIFRASLGFNPGWKEMAPGIWLPPGITIPCLAGADIWYIQVRTSKAARHHAKQRGRPLAKYHAMTGSHLKALYGANEMVKAKQGIVVEGEFDKLLLSQFVPEDVAVATMGSANSFPSAKWRLYFIGTWRIFLTLDHDAAGQAAVKKWSAKMSWAKLMPPFEGKDVTDYWQAGGDLAAWVEQALSLDESIASHSEREVIPA